MNLLEEIKQRKLKRQVNPLTVEFTVENPLPHWEKAWEEVSGSIRGYCRTNRITFCEFIEECRTIDNGAVVEFYRLWDIVDCDVYGRWLDNTLTNDRLLQFYSNVDEWKDTVRKLFALHEHQRQKQIPGGT
jgi:hypothetical protein